MISLICAMGKNRIIGSDNRLPWSLPADLAYFKSVTDGHIVVMGRKTYQSISHPLINRTNIVLSTNPDLQFDGCIMARTVNEVLELAKNENVFVIGGAMVFREFLPYAGKLYLTLINAEFEGDVSFPELDPQWHLISRVKGTTDAANPFQHDFLLYERR